MLILGKVKGSRAQVCQKHVQRWNVLNGLGACIETRPSEQVRSMCSDATF
jgi:hypothetical protein